MKKYLLNAPQQSEVNVVDSLLAEMVLERAILDFRKKQIRKEIDLSLASNDKEAFLRLTDELRAIS